MTFSSKQARALRSKLSYRHVKTRVSNGTPIAYVEGWHVIAEANRIFGFDSWDRTTLSPRCVWSKMERGETVCFYSTRVRVTVRAGASVITREGIGTGAGRSSQPDLAHEIALKAAETDATKRALATFGNPFGLALYDKEQTGVTKRQGGQGRAKATFILTTGTGDTTTYDAEREFIAAVLEAVPRLTSVDALYAFWETNLPTFTELRRLKGVDDPIAPIVALMKERARALGAPPVGTRQRAEVPKIGDDTPDPAPERPAPGVASALAHPKERRIRDKAHLTFVASQPCLVCGRAPAQAHHLRFAQPRAMAMKVSDEFTVPLCNLHHDQLHRTGDERAWWARHGILDPIKIAGRLWAASRGISPRPAAKAEGPSAPPSQAPVAPKGTAAGEGDHNSRSAHGAVPAERTPAAE